MLKVIKIVSIIAVLIVTVLFTYLQFGCSSNTNYIEIGTLIILALTLVAIIFYVADTHTIAKASEATYRELISRQEKQWKKLSVWEVLEETAPTSLTIEQISERTGIDTEQLKPLLYEMLEEGTIFQALLGNFVTRKPKSYLSNK